MVDTFDASRISGYELDYIRKLVRAKKILGRKWGQSWQNNRKSLSQFMNQRESAGQKRGAKTNSPKIWKVNSIFELL